MKKLIIISFAAMSFAGCASTSNISSEPKTPGAFEVALGECKSGATPYARVSCTLRHERSGEFTLYEKTLLSFYMVQSERLEKKQITRAEYDYEINKFNLERKEKLDAEISASIRSMQANMYASSPRYTNCYNSFGHLNCTTF